MTSATRERLPALDALRGIAALMVLAKHLMVYIPAEPLSRVQVLTSAGWMGVQLFFVLSGFLITRILLEAKARRDAGGGGYFRRFYERRLRRIAPVSFLTMAVVFGLLPLVPGAVGLEASRVRMLQLPYWLYVANWRVVWHEVPFLSHFWSLAAEEQFYLAWPLVVLWCGSPRRLGLVCVASILLVPLLRGALIAAGASPEAVYLNTLTRMDALAWGALVAVVFVDPAWRERAPGVARRALAPVGYALLGVFAMTGLARLHPLMQTVGYSLIAAASAAVVTLAAGSPGSRVTGWLAGSDRLKRVGVLSYGVYAYHMPIRDVAMLCGLTVEAWTAAVGSYLFAQVAYLGAIGGATLLMAAASWRWIERPVLEGGLHWQRSHRAPPVAVDT